MNRTQQQRDRGAVAVEFALVVPLLIMVLVGIIEFANFFRIQMSVTQAAREAARSMAISNDQTKAKAAGALGAGASVDPSQLGYGFSTPTCSQGSTMTVTVSYPLNSLAGGALKSLTGAVLPSSVKGVSAMRCGG